MCCSARSRGTAAFPNTRSSFAPLPSIRSSAAFRGLRSRFLALQRLGIEYELIRSDIGPIVFDIRKEPNPCSLCAKLRRGALHDAAKAHGCNKIALGHHFDDAVETFVMNLFREGRVGCFAPVTYLSRKDLTMIRPLVFAPEQQVQSCAKRNGLTAVESKCPARQNDRP